MAGSGGAPAPVNSHESDGPEVAKGGGEFDTDSEVCHNNNCWVRLSLKYPGQLVLNIR